MNGLLGELAVSVVGDINDVKQSFREAGDESLALQTSMQQMGQKIGNIGQKMTMMVTGPLAAIGGGMATAAFKTSNYAKEVNRAAQATGASIEGYQELSYALGQMGVQSDDTKEALIEVNRVMGEAAQGDEKMQKRLQAVGLSMEDIQNMDADQAFMEIVDGLNQMESQGRKTAIAGRLLGEDVSMRLLPAINEGAGSISKMRQEAQELGLVISDEGIKYGAEFARTLKSLKMQAMGLFRQLGTELIPVFNNELIPILKSSLIPNIKGVVDFLVDGVKWFSSLSDSMQSTVLAATGILGVTGPFLAVLGPIISGLSALVPLVAGLGTAIGATTSPLLAGTAAIVGLGTVIFEVVRNWESASDMFANAIKYIIDWAKLMVTRAKMAFFALPGIVLKAVSAIIKNLEVLENVPFIGEKFKGLSNAVENASNSMQQKVKELGQTADKQSDNMMASFSAMGSSAKEFGIDVVGDVKSAMGGLADMVTGTAEAVDIQTKSVEVNTDKTEKNTQAKNENADANEKAKEEIKPLNVAFEKTSSNIEKQSSSFQNLKSPMEMVTEEFQNQTQAMAGNAEISDKLQSKLDQVEQKEKVFGDQVDVSARKSRILKSAIEEKLKTHDAESAEVQNLISLYNQYSNEKEKDAKKTEKMAQSMHQTMSNSFQKILTDTQSFADVFTATQQMMSDIVGGIYNEMANQIASSLAKTVLAQDKWLAKTVANLASAVSSAVSAAYAQLLAFYSWAGPGAPALAAGTIGAGMATMGALANQAMELIGLEEGGKAKDETVAMIGEGSDEEAILPLNDQVFAELANGIVTQVRKLGESSNTGRQPSSAGASAGGRMNSGQSAAQRVTNVNQSKEEKELHLHIGTLVADNLGLKKLERRLQNIRVDENNRKSGGNNGS